ncbi:MAG: hypothetical protein K9G13_03035 [Aquiluna sp.]|nr:hypothetical protein [Aquiluna sp.]MCF8545498.1 hypothetical protein [Aquiluna sp.]
MSAAAAQRLSPWQALGSPLALSWRTHVLFLFPAFSAGIFSDYLRLGGNPLNWIVVTLAGFLATVISIELLEQFTENRKFGNQQVRHLLVLFIAGLVRGFVVFFLGNSLGAIPDSDFSYRILGAPVFVIATYIIFNTLVASYLTQREATLKLRRDRATLDSSRAIFADEIVRLREAQKAKIREFIAPSMWEISKLLDDAKLSQNASNLIKALRGLNEEVVRPLSHSLSKKAEVPDITSGITPLIRLGSFTIPRLTTLGNSLPVGWLVIFTSLVGYSSQAVRSGLVQAMLDTTVTMLWIWAGTFLVKMATKKETHLTWLGFVLAFPIGGLVGASTAALMPFSFLQLAPEFPLQAALFLALSYPSVYMISVANLQNQAATTALREVVADLKLLNSQLRQQVWLDQKMLATELHGSLQASLHAAALRLSQLDKPTVKDLEKVKKAVDQALGALGETAYLEGQTFEGLMDDIAEVWEGSCEITHQIRPQALIAMDQDQRAARCVIEVVRESITNAIKHGNASKVQVEIGIKRNLVELRVSNNGSSPANLAPGLGSDIVAELTHTAKLNQSAGKVIFSATVPLSLEGASASL